MPNVELKLNYRGPSVDLAGCLAAAGNDVPRALELQADLLVREAVRARAAAKYLTEHPDVQVVSYGGQDAGHPLTLETPAVPPANGLVAAWEPDIDALVAGIVPGPESEWLQSSTPLSAEVLANMYGQAEKDGTRVGWVLMDARTYADLRKYGRDLLTIETRRYLLQRGVMGYMWGATLATSRKVGPYLVHVLSESGECRATVKVTRTVRPVGQGPTVEQ